MFKQVKDKQGVEKIFLTHGSITEHHMGDSWMIATMSK